MPLATLTRAPAARPGDDGSGVDDAALLARFTRTGDQEAFSALVRRHGSAVLGVCRRILRDDHAADDAFQAVFMVLAARAGEVARPEVLGAWLYGVALRVALKARSRREPTAGEPVESAVNPDPAAGLAAAELRVILDEELGQLPAADRDLLVLIYLDGMTHDEAARAVGCPLGSVSWRLDRARESLRKRLARRGVLPSVGLLLLLASADRAAAVDGALVGRAAGAAATRPAAPAARTPWVRIAAILLCLLLGGTAVGAWATFDHPTPEPAAPGMSVPDPSGSPAPTPGPPGPGCNACKGHSG